MPFHKRCDHCRNKTCIKTKKICDSLDKWLRKEVETPYERMRNGTSKDSDYTEDIL